MHKIDDKTLKQVRTYLKIKYNQVQTYIISENTIIYSY